MENDLLNRTFLFGVAVIKFLITLPDTSDLKIIKYQLVKAAISIGVNYEEAQEGSSKADFINKVNIALAMIMRNSPFSPKTASARGNPMKPLLVSVRAA